MRLEIKGIKCDTRHCNYASWEVPFEDYPNWINKRCPVCGSNLLTQSEYDRCISINYFTKTGVNLRINLDESDCRR